VRGDLLAHRINRSELVSFLIDGVEIFVHSLIYEYEYYKKRTGQVEQNQEKIKLIEVALEIG
jgi:hypothetical protein